ncbi:MAG: nucleoside triphosphate pyrophosphatase [Bacilli bacterium]
MIILASQSPRRKEILEDILGDIPFKTIPSSFDEKTIQEKNVHKLCLEEARGKGKTVSLDNPEDYVISSDTMVCYDNKLLGKPKDYQDALDTLRMLSGNTHEIVTAYSIFKNGEELLHRVCIAHLFIEKMADLEIEEYLDTGSPFDKAGSYGVQDSDFITSKIVDGDIFTIMGLPRDDLEDDLVKLKIID